MSTAPLTWVICYDIENDRVRARLVRELERHAARVQKSVFEARMDRKSADALFRKLESMITGEDHLRFYPLPDSQLGLCRAAGGAPTPEEGFHWIA